MACNSPFTTQLHPWLPNSCAPVHKPRIHAVQLKDIPRPRQLPRVITEKRSSELILGIHKLLRLEQLPRSACARIDGRVLRWDRSGEDLGGRDQLNGLDPSWCRRVASRLCAETRLDRVKLNASELAGGLENPRSAKVTAHCEGVCVAVMPGSSISRPCDFEGRVQIRCSSLKVEPCRSGFPSVVAARFCPVAEPRHRQGLRKLGRNRDKEVGSIRWATFFEAFTLSPTRTDSTSATSCHFSPPFPELTSQSINPAGAVTRLGCRQGQYV